MAVFYIDSPTFGILELTATTDINIQRPNSVTKHPLESGDTVTDNVVNQNIMISFDGMISEIKSLPLGPRNLRNQQRTVRDYIGTLSRLRDSKELFTVFYDTRFEPFRNCVIRSVDESRNASTGTAYNIKLAFEQVRLSARAELVEVRRQTAPNVTSEQTSASNTTTVEQTLPTRSLLGGVLFGDASTGGGTGGTATGITASNAAGADPNASVKQLYKQVGSSVELDIIGGG